MEVRFGQDYLRILYTEGKDDKKHRFQSDIIRRYQKCIKIMTNVADIPTLSRINSLNYEELKGDMKGLSSVRVNDKYRIVFKVTIVDTIPVTTICLILGLSNHYE